MFAGEGTPERTNRRFHYLARRPAGRAPVDRVRLASRCTAKTRTPRPDIYGKIGNSGVIDRHARRHEEAVLRLRPVRADDLGVDDHQRPGADDPGDVHEHRHRPAGREVPARGPGALGRGARQDRRSCSRARERPQYARRCCPRATTASAWACSASPATRCVDAETYARIKAETLSHRARHRAGRHPQGRPGAEHLHLLAPSSRCA